MADEKEPRPLTRKESREWQAEVQSAYADGFDAGKDKECVSSGSIKTLAQCGCRGCCGAKAAADKAVELTKRYRLFEDPTPTVVA